jgi:hypothetical protein
MGPGERRGAPVLPSRRARAGLPDSTRPGLEALPAMDQVWTYLGYALYAAIFVSFAILMFHFLWHKQWLFAILSVAFLPACYTGFLFALVIGWQESPKWHIKRLMQVYTVLLFCFFIMFARAQYKEFTTPKPLLDEMSQRKQKHAARQFNKN